jgi:dTDP-4-amino-4,6-dideoxygalactose transaminase
MAVPLLDLKIQYQAIKDEVLAVTEEVYASQMFILGRKVEEFESEFATYCATGYSVGVSSGTDALLIALMVLDLEPGDEVIVPAYSFFATAGVVSRLGLKPVFVDIEPESFNIDPAAIEREIGSRTRAIIPVHLFGQVAEMDAINAMARKHGLHVIEDAAQAVGAALRKVKAGAHSPLGCFSFFPSKNLGAFGDAGAVTTSDPKLYEKLVDFRVHGMRPKYYHHSVGGNFRIDALQAAILRVKLRHLDSWHEGRRANACTYFELFEEAGLGDRVRLPQTLPDRYHIYNQFCIRFPEGRPVRDKVMEHLKSAGIGCDIYYPLTLPQQQCFRDLPSVHQSFPHAEAAAAESLAIPIFPELTKDQLAEVVREIGKGLGAGR